MEWMLHIVFICFAEMDDPEKELGALEHILVDANADPIALSYASLFKVTNGFSQEIGRGGFGSVYMV